MASILVLNNSHRRMIEKALGPHILRHKVGRVGWDKDHYVEPNNLVTDDVEEEVTTQDDTEVPHQSDTEVLTITNTEVSI